MSSGLARRQRGLVSFTVIATLAVACSSGTVAGPGDATPGRNLDGRAAGPSGLEQRVVTRVGAPPSGSPYRAMLTATSTLVNTGTAPVRVTSRTCLFLQTDVDTDAIMDRFEPLISCAAVSMTVDLAPGQATPAMDVQFGVRSGPGTYTLRLRQSLAPAFSAAASFRIP